MGILNDILNKLSWWKTNANNVLRASASSSTTSPANVALESYNFWKIKTNNQNAIFALLGNEDGETSFILGVVGDKKTGGAHSIFQWHQARIDIMKAPVPKGCGIDVSDVNCSHLQALEAAYWEMNHAPGYNHVWSKLVACTTIKDAVTVLVHDYEHSGSQERDIVRRTAFAEKWQIQFATTPSSN